MNAISPDERALIDAALAAGRVQKLPMGGTAQPGYVWDGKTRKLVSTDPASAGWKGWQRMFTANRRARGETAAVDARRAKVASMVTDGTRSADIATALGVSITTVYADAKRAGVTLDRQSGAQARSRYDPKVQETRALINQAYDGIRTTPEIELITGIPRRTVVDHLKALGLPRIAGKSGLKRGHAITESTAARRAQIPALIAQGLAGAKIAAHLNTHHSTIHHDCHVLKISIPRKTAASDKPTRQKGRWAKKKHITNMASRSKMLVRLTEYGVPADIQELLIAGNPDAGIRPDILGLIMGL